MIIYYCLLLIIARNESVNFVKNNFWRVKNKMKFEIRSHQPINDLMCEIFLDSIESRTFVQYARQGLWPRTGVFIQTENRVHAFFVCCSVPIRKCGVRDDVCVRVWESLSVCTYIFLISTLSIMWREQWHHITRRLCEALVNPKK